MSDSEKPLRPVITYPRDAILDKAHVCALLGVTDATVDKMDLPCFYAGNRARYIWGQVLDALSARASSDALPAPTLSARRRRTG